MNKKQLFAGKVSLGIATVFALFDLTVIKASFNDTFLANVSIYPATFFTLLGLLLMYFGLRPLWRN